MCQERNADDRDRKWHRPMATHYALEMYFADIYTDEKFLEVSKQCERVADGFVCEQVKVDENLIEYVIDDSIWVFKEGCRVDVWTDKRRLYRVLYNVESSVALCECRMFETHGIMCRHIIRVLYQNKVTVPPEMYVLHRWKKNVDRKHTRIKVAYHDPRRTKEVKRLDRMQNVFDILVDKACWYEVRTQRVIDSLTQLAGEMEGLQDEVGTDQEEEGNPGAGTVFPQHTPEGSQSHTKRPDQISSSTPFHTDDRVTQTLRDPPRRKKRGRPKGSRPKSVAENAMSKSRRSKKKDNTSSSDTEQTEQDVDTQSPHFTVDKNVRKGKASTKQKQNKVLSSSSDSEESREFEDTNGEELTMNTRSKTSYGGRKKTKKRLYYNFSSSSDDQSLTF